MIEKPLIPGPHMKAKKRSRAFIFAALLLAFLTSVPGYAETKDVKSAKEAKGSGPQEGVITFETSAFANRRLVVNDIVEIEDSYLLLGWSLIIKIDKSGTVLWEQDFSSLKHSPMLYRHLVLDKKSLIYGGEFRARETVGESAIIVKLNLDDGSIEWERRFSLGKFDEIEDIRRTPTGIVALVNIDRNIQDARHLSFFTTLDLDGNILSTKEVSGTYTPYQIEALPDGDGFFVGMSRRIGRIDNEGKLLWELNVGPNNYVSISLLKVIDGELYVGGDHHLSSWMVKLDLDGKLVWESDLGVDGACRTSDLWKTDSGEMVMIGDTCDNDKELYWAGLFSERAHLRAYKKFLPKLDDGTEEVRGLAIPSNFYGFMLFGFYPEDKDDIVSIKIVKERFGFKEAP